MPRGQADLAKAAVEQAPAEELITTTNCVKEKMPTAGSAAVGIFSHIL